ncbi:pyridoxal phosphate-dependent aminotransferase [Devosia sp.]|uniref:pyridoxal phosphate-dependent aminotransferase n=1 Tax=Devosia sp. TaxID=1871048 RepID=UPI002622257A|nr:pyridoxal phosphate-dependent aminotransferase [Devosia sp.]
MAKPNFTPIVAALPQTVPFVGPEALQRRSGITMRARIGANESGFGPSPAVKAAIAEAAGDVWKYPDPDVFDLRATVAAHVGVTAGEISIGEGIDGLMSVLVRMFISPGEIVVTSAGAYPTFNYHVVGYGGQLRFVPYKDDHEHLEALLDEVRRTNARMVYLANPDNPMGTWWPAEAVNAFIAALPESCLFVLDEAYGETAPAGTLPPLDAGRPNVLRLRTFSKAYGLAGIRCGYAIGDADLIGGFDRVRNHFGVSRLSQLAAGIALEDQAYLDQAVASIHRANDRIAAIAADNGLSAIPTATNFVAVDCGRDGAYALRVLEELGQLGIFVRKPMAPGLDRCIRVSAAPDREMDLFAEALPTALRKAHGAG